MHLKEALAALVDGYELRAKSWHPADYIYFDGENNLIDQDNVEQSDLFAVHGEWEFFRQRSEDQIKFSRAELRNLLRLNRGIDSYGDDFPGDSNIEDTLDKVFGTVKSDVGP